MPDKKKPICLIVDDDHMSAHRLSKLLHQSGAPWDILESYYSDEALRRTSIEKPEILFLDVEMPGLSGFQLLEKIRAMGLHPQVVFVTGYDHYAIRAIRAGAYDYLLKPVDFDELSQAVNRLIDKSLTWNKRRSLSDFEIILSTREMEIARLMLQGLKIEEIAEKLHLSSHTIHSHKKSIYKKTGVHSISDYLSNFSD